MRLKDLRLKKNFTQRQIAEIIGVGKSTYSYWENGTFEPDNETLKKLADYFEVSVDYLLERTEIPEPKFDYGKYGLHPVTNKYPRA